MKVRWLGHAAFLLMSDQGVRVITDPYAPDERLTYGEIDEAADAVTVSHEHGDHANVSAVGGNPQAVRGAGVTQARGIEFTGVSTFHDAEKGGERGANTLFCFDLDGVRVCHLGDLGHALSEQQVSEVGAIDVLLVPVGGNYTIDASVATETCAALNPRVVIPMHYGTDKCAFPIEDVEPFLRGRANVRRVAGSEIELKKEDLPQVTETVVLEHAL